jgi:hypothetical protein
VLTNTIFEGAVERILDVSKRFGEALDHSGIPFRVVGGLAVFLHVDPLDSLAARLTKDVDVGLFRKDLDDIRAAVGPYGFSFGNYIDEYSAHLISTTCVRCHLPFAFGSHSFNSHGTTLSDHSDNGTPPPTHMQLMSKMRGSSQPGTVQSLGSLMAPTQCVWR